LTTLNYFTTVRRGLPGEGFSGVGSSD